MVKTYFESFMENKYNQILQDFNFSNKLEMMLKTFSVIYLAMKNHLLPPKPKNKN